MTSCPGHVNVWPEVALAMPGRTAHVTVLAVRREFRLGTGKIPMLRKRNAPGVVGRRQIWRERNGILICLLRRGPIAATIEKVAAESVAIHVPARSF